MIGEREERRHFSSLLFCSLLFSSNLFFCAMKRESIIFSFVSRFLGLSGAYSRGRMGRDEEQEQKVRQTD